MTDNVGMFFQVFFVYFTTNFTWSALPRQFRSIHWVRWETERSFYGKLCQEYSYQKLSKSVKCFSSNSQKCQECLFLRHSVLFFISLLLDGHFSRFICAMSKSFTSLLSYAAVLMGCIAGLVCPSVSYGLLTRKQKGHRKTKINVDVPQCRSNECVSF